MTTASIGLISTGAMGAPMAQRLLAAGSRTLVHSRSVRPVLQDAGAVYVDSPRELADQADTILVMLPDLPLTVRADSAYYQHAVVAGAVSRILHQRMDPTRHL